MRPEYKVRKVYSGVGLSIFPFDFKVIDLEDLLVLKLDGDNIVDWQARATSATYFTTTRQEDGTGYITTVNPLVGDETIILLLAPDLPNQPSKFRGFDKYTMDKIEGAFDEQSGQLQRIRYLLDRSFRLPEAFIGNFVTQLESIEPESVMVFEYDIPGDAWSIRSVPRTEFKGDKGDTGPSPTIQVNPVVIDVDYEDEAGVTIDNTDPDNPVLNFTLRAGPEGPQGQSTVLITATDQLPNNAIGGNGDMWFVFDVTKPQNGNVYQKVAGNYELKGNILGPPGGVISIDGETGPIVFNLAGQYSAHYNKTITATTLRQALVELYDIQYVKPAITSFTGTNYNTLREKGTVVSNPVLSVVVQKKSDPIATIRYYNESMLMTTQNAGGAIPNGGTSTYGTVLNFSDNKTFNVEVDDTHAPIGTANASVTYQFVYPYYVGAGAQNLSAAAVAGLTKRVIQSTASREETITVANGQVPYFAYPAAYGALTSVKDASGFEVFTSFKLRTENITGLDGTPVSYRIYEGLNPLTGADYKFTFIR